MSSADFREDACRAKVGRIGPCEEVEAVQDLLLVVTHSDGTKVNETPLVDKTAENASPAKVVSIQRIARLNFHRLKLVFRLDQKAEELYLLRAVAPEHLEKPRECSRDTGYPSGVHTVTLLLFE